MSSNPFSFNITWDDIFNTGIITPPTHTEIESPIRLLLQEFIIKYSNNKTIFLNKDILVDQPQTTYYSEPDIDNDIQNIRTINIIKDNIQLQGFFINNFPPIKILLYLCGYLDQHVSSLYEKSFLSSEDFLNIDYLQSIIKDIIALIQYKFKQIQKFYNTIIEENTAYDKYTLQLYKDISDIYNKFNNDHLTQDSFIEIRKIINQYDPATNLILKNNNIHLNSELIKYKLFVGNTILKFLNNLEFILYKVKMFHSKAYIAQSNTTDKAYNTILIQVDEYATNKDANIIPNLNEFKKKYINTICDIDKSSHINLVDDTIYKKVKEEYYKIPYINKICAKFNNINIKIDNILINL